jgi:polyisoprenoid-binding protein YceI
VDAQTRRRSDEMAASGAVVAIDDNLITIGNHKPREDSMTTPTDPLSELGLRAGRWERDSAHSAVLFSIRHLGLAKVRGRFDRFEAVLEVGPSLAGC